MELQIPPDPLQANELCDELVALVLSQVVSVRLTTQPLEALFLPEFVLERFPLLALSQQL